MILIQVNHVRLERCPELRRLRDPKRKLRLTPFTTVRTHFDLRLMFGHLNSHWREIKDLAFGIIADRNIA